MDLKIKVQNIVTRLEPMKLQSSLEHDPEFLAAIYSALPDRYILSSKVLRACLITGKKLFKLLREWSEV